MARSSRKTFASTRKGIPSQVASPRSAIVLSMLLLHANGVFTCLLTSLGHPSEQRFVSPFGIAVGAREGKTVNFYILSQVLLVTIRRIKAIIPGSHKKVLDLILIHSKLR